MLAERMSALFTLLSCTNTQIAHFAGCTPSNISRIRTGARTPKSTSNAMVRIADGIYRHADNENLLPALCELCEAEANSRESVVPALLAWLYDTEAVRLPPRSPAAPEKDAHRDFGKKLNAVMELLELSNTRLARSLSVDNSLISRFRNGLRSPGVSHQLRQALAGYLFTRAVQQAKLAELAALCRLPQSLLAGEEGLALFTGWLYADKSEDSSLAIDQLLASLEGFSPEAASLPQQPPPAVPARPPCVYWGDAGLQQAVLRFLSGAARTGGELWLYSDEPMGWLTEDRAFTAQWASLMTACIKAGVRIRILHNITRSLDEMVAAIMSWMPLYMSGRISPFACRKPKDPRFSRTLFLHPGHACVFGSHVSAPAGLKWYDYITEADKLAALEAAYETLLESADPLLQVYAGAEEEGFFRVIRQKASEKTDLLLSSLFLATFPEPLFRAKLEREVSDPLVRESVLTAYQKSRSLLNENLASGKVYEFARLPTDAELFAGKAALGLDTKLFSQRLYYTPEEFAQHVEAVSSLLAQEKNYHLFLLPELPFPDIQIICQDERTFVLRSKPPYAAFVFTEALMNQAFRTYFVKLKTEYSMDRYLVQQRLRRYL